MISIYSSNASTSARSPSSLSPVAMANGRRLYHSSPLNPFSSSSTHKSLASNRGSILDRISDSQQYSVKVEQNEEWQQVSNSTNEIDADTVSTSQNRKKRIRGDNEDSLGGEEDEDDVVPRELKKRLSFSNQLVGNLSTILNL